MDNITKLNKILATMRYPKSHHQDYGWLEKHLGAYNGNNPQYQEALELIRQIKKGK